MVKLVGQISDLEVNGHGAMIPTRRIACKVHEGHSRTGEPRALSSGLASLPLRVPLLPPMPGPRRLSHPAGRATIPSRMSLQDTADAEPIPGALNLALAAAASTAALGLLVFASRTPSWGWRIAAAVAFSYVNNKIFSLLTTTVHGHLSAT